MNLIIYIQSKFKTQQIIFLIFAWLVFGIINLFTFSRLYINQQITPSDRVYLGLEVDAIDFTWNMTTIHQGYNGHWLSQLHYSSTLPPSKSVLKIEYILTGHLARLLGITPLNSYYLVRFVCSLLMFLFIFWIIIKTFSRLLDRCLALVIIFLGGGIVLPSFARLVIDAQVLYRFTIAAIHYQLGGLLAFVSLYCFSLYIQSGMKRKRWINLALMLGFLGSWINAPSITFILLATGLYLVCFGGYLVVKNRSLYWFKTHVLWFLTYGFFLALPMLYVHYVRSVVWAPYHFMRTEELNPFSPKIMEYVFYMGLPYWLAIFGLVKAWRTNSVFLRICLFFLVVHPLGIFLLPKILEFNTIRFMLVPYSFVLGLLAIFGVKQMLSIINRVIQTAKGIHWLYGLIGIVIIVSSYTSYQYAFANLKAHYTYDWMFYFAAPMKQHLLISEWVRDNVQEDEVVMTHLHVGTIMSAFSGKKMLITWWMKLAEVPTQPALLDRIQDFYGMRMTRSEALIFLKQNDVRYILHGPMERIYNWPDMVITYDFLEPVVRVEETTLYRVNAD